MVAFSKAEHSCLGIHPEQIYIIICSPKFIYKNVNCSTTKFPKTVKKKKKKSQTHINMGHTNQMCYINTMENTQHENEQAMTMWSNMDVFHKH